MTIKDCIDIVDNIKPNQYTIKEKVMWLSFIDEIIINEVLKTHEGYDGIYDDFEGYSEDKLSVPLIVPSPYDRLYTAYLKMKIDQENGETARYNNSAALYNTYMLEFRKHYNKTHMPLDSSNKRVVTTLKRANVVLSDAEYENLKRDLTYILTEYFSNAVSDDKIYDVVNKFVQNNIEMLKGKDGKDGIDGINGTTPKTGVDYFTKADKEDVVNVVIEKINIPTKLSDLEDDTLISPVAYAKKAGLDGLGRTIIDTYVTNEEFVQAVEYVENTYATKEGAEVTVQANWLQDNPTKADYIQNKPYVDKGIGVSSIIANDTENNIAGMKGFYYSNIEFGIEDENGNRQDTITLSDKQDYGTDTNTDLSNIILQYPENALISIVNGSKYPNCSKILSIDGNIITIEKLPFTEVEITDDVAMDDYSLWVESCPEIGIVKLGYYAYSEGEKTVALERASHAEGRETLAYGQYSHTEGRKTRASYAAHAEGYNTHAEGFYSHAEGYGTISSGDCSHAEGYYNKATYQYSHAEGAITEASGFASHTEGYITEASGFASHAEGHETKAKGDCQHVSGKYNDYENNKDKAVIVGNGDSEDNRSNAYTLDWNGNAEFAGTVKSDGKLLATEEFVINSNEYNLKNKSVGQKTSGGGEIFNDYEKNVASGDYSHAEGSITEATGAYSHAEGYYTKAIAQYSHAEGSITEATGAYSHAEGYYTKAIAQYSHAEGCVTSASGLVSHAEGYRTEASGAYSHGEGSITKASGLVSHAEGHDTISSGDYSHAEGYRTEASGAYSHGEGSITKASGLVSHAEGGWTVSAGNYSHAEGYCTVASGDCQHVSGKYNDYENNKDKAVIVGNGKSEEKRSNAYTLDWSGNAEFAGAITSKAIILESSTKGSNKKFRLTIDDTGSISVVEV